MEHNKLFVAWLNDAHAMEHTLIEVLENHVDDAKDYPEVQDRIRQHLEETRRHEETIKECIKSLGEDPSDVKAGIGTLKGKMAAVMSAPAKDELVKNALMDYSSEHFEIAAYNALIVAAEHLGHPEIATKCKEILKEEEAMAKFLESNLPTTIKEALDKEEMDEQDD